MEEGRLDMLKDRKKGKEVSEEGRKDTENEGRMEGQNLDNKNLEIQIL